MVFRVLGVGVDSITMLLIDRISGVVQHLVAAGDLGRGLGETFLGWIRGSALAIAVAAQWIANFAIAVTLPILVFGIGPAGAKGIGTAGALLSMASVLK